MPQYKATILIETDRDMPAVDVHMLLHTALEHTVSDNWDYDVVDWSIEKTEKEG